MRRRDFIRNTGYGSLLSLLPQGLGAAPNKRPNFVFILADDLGWADLGCYGSSYYESPNLDKFASTGMRFTDAYAACPVCSPTRASIMTGKYPARVGITDYIPGLSLKNTKLTTPEDLHALPLSEVTIAEAMKEAGYQTFISGKWHLGEEGHMPTDQGFDINFDKAKLGFKRGYFRKTAGGKEEYLTDRLVDKSVEFLNQAKNDPFFLYLPFHTVHTPIQACKRHLKRFEDKLKKMRPAGPESVKERNGVSRLRQDDPAYASMVYAMDENVGRVLTKLDELNLADNTVVMFFSDNGGLCTKTAPGPTSNLPLRSGKGWCYEGGIREPLIVRAPGVTKAGSVCGAPVISTDFYPTMLELAGLPARPKQHVDGVSIAPLLKGGNPPEREAIYWHYPHYHGSTWAPGAAVRAGDWKLIEFYEEDAVELYNLSEDIGERNNLAKSRPEKARELLQMLHAWQKEAGAKLPKPNPDYKPE